VIKEFELNGQSSYYSGYDSPGSVLKEKINVFMRFRNSEENKLGMPLPAGTIRLYQRMKPERSNSSVRIGLITRRRTKRCG